MPRRWAARPTRRPSSRSPDRGRDRRRRGRQAGEPPCRRPPAPGRARAAPGRAIPEGAAASPTPAAPQPAERVRIYEVGPRDGLQNEARAVPTADKIEFIRRLAAAGLRRSRPRASCRRVRSRSWPTPRRCWRRCRPRPGVRYPVLVPNMRGFDRAAAAGARGAGRVHGRDRRVHRAQHRDDGRGVARRVAPVLDARRRAGLVAARLRLDRVRLPVHGPRRAGSVPSTSRCACSSSASTRSATATRSAWPCPSHVGASSTVGRGRDPDRLTAFHFHDTRGTALANVVAGLGRRRALLRQLHRRDRRLPVRTGRGRQPCDRGPRVPARRPRATSTASRWTASSSGAIHQRRPGPAARQQGRAGGRLGSPVGSGNGSRVSLRRYPQPVMHTRAYRGVPAGAGGS